MPRVADRVAFVLDGTCGDTSLLGGKGAALDRLIGWGLPVPVSAVVTAAVSRAVAGQPAVEAVIARAEAGDPCPADEVDAVFAAAALAPDVVDEIRAAAAAVVAGHRGRHLAIRSSATAEDMHQHSFAGQYRSLLDIDPDDEVALLGAIRAVLASLWHPAPVAYREAAGIPQRSVAMAVVMMEMVPALRAGVVFTVDPVGDGSTARVEVVDGLGEALVSGQRTPTVHVVARQDDPIGAGLDVELGAALRSAMLVEEFSGLPQDVEFAWDGTTSWVVQARPITTISTDPGDGFDDDPTVLAALDLTTAGIGEMLPGALPPLRYEVCAHLVEQAFRSTFADLGVALDRGDPTRRLLRRVRGRAAMDFGLLQEWTAQLPGADVGLMEEQYFGSRRPSASAPPTPVHRPGPLARARNDWRTIRSRRRADIDAELSIQAVAELVADPVALGGMDDRALMAYWVRLVDLAARAMTAELGVAAQAAGSYRRLESLLAGRLGAERGAAAAGQLTVGIDPGPALPQAQRNRASAAVFAGPTWTELGRSAPSPSDRATDADADGELRALYETLDPDGGLRASLRVRSAALALEDALEQLSRRERAKAALLRLGGEVRRVHREAGDRLVARGRLVGWDDVELLSVGELRIALSDGVVPAPDVLARRRRAMRRADGGPPLPARFSGADPHSDVEVPVGDRLDGWAVSGGRFTGIARVVRSPVDEFPEGAVLVADATDPSWSPLFMKAGAIVLERGGPLSHAAILARELGVPAITNVPAATRRLAGCVVSVDGDRGVVIVVDEGSHS